MSVFDDLHIQFNTERHVSHGAPENFYGARVKILLKIDVQNLIDFVNDYPVSWMKRLTILEKTVRYPDKCEYVAPATIRDELLGGNRLVLTRNVKGVLCKCTIIEVDGRFNLCLCGRYAPSWKGDI